MRYITRVGVLSPGLYGAVIHPSRAGSTLLAGRFPPPRFGASLPEIDGRTLLTAMFRVSGRLGDSLRTESSDFGDGMDGLTG